MKTTVLEKLGSEQFWLVFDFSSIVCVAGSLQARLQAAIEPDQHTRGKRQVWWTH